MKYRTHDDGPLVVITVQPGAVVVTMTFERPGENTSMHSHTFDHWMACCAGSALIEIDGRAVRVATGDRYFVAAHKRHSIPWASVGTVLECRHEHADIHPDNAQDGIPIEWLRRLTDTEGEHALI